MEMCYDGALVMPSSYAVMDEEEMMYVEGGEGITATITLALAAVGASYKAASCVGERMAYTYTKKQYKKVKWAVRAGCIAYMGVIPAGIALCEFENGFYKNAK